MNYNNGDLIVVDGELYEFNHISTDLFYPHIYISKVVGITLCREGHYCTFYENQVRKATNRDIIKFLNRELSKCLMGANTV